MSDMSVSPCSFLGLPDNEVQALFSVSTSEKKPIEGGLEKAKKLISENKRLNGLIEEGSRKRMKQDETIKTLNEKIACCHEKLEDQDKQIASLKMRVSLLMKLKKPHLNPGRGPLTLESIKGLDTEKDPIVIRLKKNSDKPLSDL